MDYGDIPQRGLVLLGCGKMGGAMLQGWLDGGLPPQSVAVIDPFLPDWVGEKGVAVDGTLPEKPAIIVVAVKPQLMAEAIGAVQHFGGGDSVVVSVAAGTKISYFEEVFGEGTPVVRAMPNTPAAIGQGITALCSNDHSTEAQFNLASRLLAAVGQTVALENEAQIDAVTAVSGSGPAYVFHLIECMTEAGVAEGLPRDMATKLATATVAGAGALAAGMDESAAQLRVNVTSPNGTTQAALEVLMDDVSGLKPVMQRAIKAAADRSRELGK